MSPRAPMRMSLSVLAVLLPAAIGCGAPLPPHSRPAPELQPLFDALNTRAFEGRLSAEVWAGRDDECYGRSAPMGARNGGALLVVDERLSGRPLEAVMAHEMVHLWLHGDVINGLIDGGHGPRFQAECARVAAMLGMPVGLLTGDPYGPQASPAGRTHRSARSSGRASSRPPAAYPRAEGDGR